MSSNYEYKAEILKSGLCKKVKKLDKDIYNAYNNYDYDFAFYEMLFCNENACTPSDIREARLINNANSKRVQRLNDRIERYLQMGCCIWLTLTFNDDTLAKTTQNTRKRYVVRYLKSQSNYYIANIDYGKENEREHYHAVLVSERVDMTAWPYGFAYTERIKNHVSSPKKISKYVSKLCNHAIKETTKRSCYIYSRVQ